MSEKRRAGLEGIVARAMFLKGAVHVICAKLHDIVKSCFNACDADLGG